MKHGFSSILQFRLTSGGLEERQVMLPCLLEHEGCISQVRLCFSEVLEIATKPVNYMEIHSEWQFQQQNNKGE